jgi:hypothetical protein
VVFNDLVKQRPSRVGGGGDGRFGYDMRPNVHGVGTRGSEINHTQRRCQVVQHAAGKDQIVSLFPVLQRLDEVPEPESRASQSQYFLCDHTAHKCQLVGFDGVHGGTGRIEHAGVAALERPKFKHTASCDRAETFDRPQDARIVIGGQRAGFQPVLRGKRGIMAQTPQAA